jgi:hypothetical protein
MKHRHLLLLLALMGWLGSGRTSLLAQEPPRSPLAPPSEETTLNPGDPPTPQFLQVELDVGADGLGLRLRLHPSWLALYRPSVRVGQARTGPPIETDTVPPLEGGADQLHQALEQALNRAQPPTTPSP